MLALDHVVTEPSWSKKRLDVYLTRYYKGQFSREQIKRVLVEGTIFLNHRPARPKDIVKTGDRITGQITTEESAGSLKPEKIPLNIIYEDKDLLAVDKPSGMVVHPGAGNKKGTLLHALLGRGGDLSTVGGRQRMGIVHRLDKDTSGLILIAKNDQTHRLLQEQFASRLVSKTYTALVAGRVEYEEGHVFDAIGRDPMIRTKMAVSEKESAREAQTYFKVIERFKFCTLLEVKIKTGRTHQIRVHMSHYGHPVVGDPVYGKTHATRWPRLGLHASRIEFVHPRTGKPMRLECPLPEAFEQMICTAKAV